MNGRDRRMRTAAVVAVGCLASVVVLADGFRNPPEVAEALGRSGGRVAHLEGPGAIFNNPANIVGTGEASGCVSVLAGVSEADYEGPLGKAETDSSVSFLPAVAGVMPLKDRAVWIGAGVHVPFGRSTRWEKDGAFRYAAPYYTQMSVVDLKPVVAWKMGERVAVGVGLDLYASELEFRQIVPWGMLTGNPADGEAKLTAEGDGTAVGASAGLTWDVARGHRVALTYRSPFDVTYKGDMEFSRVPESAATMAAPASDFETEFKFPTIVALGYGVQVGKRLRLEANVEWLEFSRFKTLTVDGGVNDGFLAASGLKRMEQDWKDTWTYGVGADWQVTPDWVLRAGYIRLESPAPDRTFMPSMIDTDQSVVSVGAGYRRGRHTFDLGYGLALFDSRRVRGNQNPAYDGHYEFEGHLAAVAYGCRF